MSGPFFAFITGFQERDSPWLLVVRRLSVGGGAAVAVSIFMCSKATLRAAFSPSFSGRASTRSFVRPLSAVVVVKASFSSASAVSAGIVLKNHENRPPLSAIEIVVDRWP